jgi:hypothetical protein
MSLWTAKKIKVLLRGLPPHPILFSSSVPKDTVYGPESVFDAYLFTIVIGSALV